MVKMEQLVYFIIRLLILYEIMLPLGTPTKGCADDVYITEEKAHVGLH